MSFKWPGLENTLDIIMGGDSSLELTASYLLNNRFPVNIVKIIINMIDYDENPFAWLDRWKVRKSWQQKDPIRCLKEGDTDELPKFLESIVQSSNHGYFLSENLFEIIYKDNDSIFICGTWLGDTLGGCVFDDEPPEDFHVIFHDQKIHLSECVQIEIYEAPDYEKKITNMYFLSQYLQRAECHASYFSHNTKYVWHTDSTQIHVKTKKTI